MIERGKISREFQIRLGPLTPLQSVFDMFVDEKGTRSWRSAESLSMSVNSEG